MKKEFNVGMWFSVYFYSLWTTCNIAASFHCGPDLCIPNRGQTVPDPGVSAGRGTLHAAREGGHLHGGHSLVSGTPTTHPHPPI